MMMAGAAGVLQGGGRAAPHPVRKLWRDRRRRSSLVATAPTTTRSLRRAGNGARGRVPATMREGSDPGRVCRMQRKVLLGGTSREPF